MVLNRLPYRHRPAARQGQGARAPTSSKGKAATRAGSLAAYHPFVQPPEPVPVGGGHAVLGEARQLVALVAGVAPHVPGVLADEARGIVLGMALDQYDLGLAHIFRDHAPPYLC